LYNVQLSVCYAKSFLYIAGVTVGYKNRACIIVYYYMHSCVYCNELVIDNSLTSGKCSGEVDIILLDLFVVQERRLSRYDPVRHYSNWPDCGGLCVAQSCGHHFMGLANFSTYKHNIIDYIYIHVASVFNVKTVLLFFYSYSCTIIHLLYISNTKMKYTK